MYSEVKRANMKLESIEKALEALMDMVLPEEKRGRVEGNRGGRG